MQNAGFGFDDGLHHQLATAVEDGDHNGFHFGGKVKRVCNLIPPVDGRHFRDASVGAEDHAE